MAESKDVRGIRSTPKKRTPIEIMTDNPALKWVSKAQFVEWRKRYNKAKVAGDLERRRIMGELDAVETNVKVPSRQSVKPEIKALNDLINTVRKELADAQQRLKDDPESKGAKISVTKLNKKLDRLEDELEEAGGL